LAIITLPMGTIAILVWSVIGLLAVCAAVYLGWRLLSRRTLLPCPSALAFSLQGGFADWWTATERTLDRIGLEAGDRVLELGPGPGRLLLPAARRVLPGGAVVGLDVQPGMIQRLEKRAAHVSNLTAMLGNGEEMPIPSDSFDVVFLAMVLGEIPDRAAALAEVFRVLKPGGRLSITEMLADPHFQSQATVARLATTAGFQPLEVFGHWYSFTANFVKSNSSAPAVGR
jgi:ubiquinone/menaquinone biosynthesis C-methylase UbiE